MTQHPDPLPARLAAQWETTDDEEDQAARGDKGTLLDRLDLPRRAAGK